MNNSTANRRLPLELFRGRQQQEAAQSLCFSNSAVLFEKEQAAEFLDTETVHYPLGCRNGKTEIPDGNLSKSRLAPEEQTMRMRRFDRLSDSCPSKYIILCALTILPFALTSCGGGSSSSPPPTQNPLPSITSLSPSSATAGAAAQTLTINGTSFLSISSVTYNGVAHTATFVSSTQLTISLSASDQATGGDYAVVVTNPAPGGGSSKSVSFVVNNPVPTVTSLSPSSVTAGAAAQTLTINGTGFVAGSVVSYNGAPHTATLVNSTQLTISLSTSDQATPGTYPVVVTNASPGGGASNAVNFTVNGPVPTITGLCPSAATPGAAAQTLTINGTNFLSISTVTYNGVAHTATFVSSTQLTISLSASDQATAGDYAVVVTNPPPGGGPSNSVSFTVSNAVPAVSQLSVDSLWIAPSSDAHIDVLDQGGCILPSGSITLQFTDYWYEDTQPSPPISDLGNGDFRLSGPTFSQLPFWHYRVQATWNGMAVPGQALVVAFSDPGQRDIYKSQSWRIFFDPDAIQMALAASPDLATALDLGKQAQDGLFGYSYQQAYNTIPGLLPHFEWQSIAEDSTTCGYNGDPIGMGAGCFVIASGAPWFAAIFHEYGHNSCWGAGYLMYGELTYRAGQFVEGDAQLLMHVSMEAAKNSGQVTASTQSVISQQLADLRSNAISYFNEWVQGRQAGTVAYDDTTTPFIWEAVGILLSEEFGGWAFMQRYVRAWRRDNQVLDMIYGANRTGDFWTTMTQTQRSTFYIAAVSAALNTDLRSQFRDWTFPIDDSLFEQLFTYLSVKMNDPIVSSETIGELQILARRVRVAERNFQLGR
jgi:hypothetical protein